VSLRCPEARGKQTLGAEVRALLDAAATSSDRAEVFWAETRKAPLSLAHYWNQWRDEAGLPGVRLHDLRHSFASHAASMSQTLSMIGKLLGYAKIASTARYAHLDAGAVFEAAERIGNLIKSRTSHASHDPTA
jgi:site-specific recombinase XerC